MIKNIQSFSCLFLLLFFLAPGCAKDVTNATTEAGNSYYFSFQTPDWGSKVYCDRLSFDYTTFPFVTSISESTKAEMTLYLPQDSSNIEQSQRIKKYPINGSSDYFSFKAWIPIVSGSATKLACVYSDLISDSSYFQVTQIAYDHSDTTSAFYTLKANYKAKMQVRGTVSPDSSKLVFGDFNILVRTRRH